jgi:hypothetical protein
MSLSRNLDDLDNLEMFLAFCQYLSSGITTIQTLLTLDMRGEGGLAFRLVIRGRAFFPYWREAFSSDEGTRIGIGGG